MHVGTATVIRDLEYLSRVIEGEDTPVNFFLRYYCRKLFGKYVNDPTGTCMASLI